MSDAVKKTLAVLFIVAFVISVFSAYYRYMVLDDYEIYLPEEAENLE